MVALHVLPFQKIIVGKSSHGGPIDYIQFEKNRLKFSFLLYKVMYFFQKIAYNSSVIDQNAKQKYLWVCMTTGHILKYNTKNGPLWALWAPKGP